MENNLLLVIANPISPTYIDGLIATYAPDVRSRQYLKFAPEDDAIQAYRLIWPGAIIIDIDSVKPSHALDIRNNLRQIAPLLPFILTARKNLPQFSFANRLTPIASSAYWLNPSVDNGDTFLESVGSTIRGSVSLPDDIMQDLQGLEDSFGGLNSVQLTIVQYLADGLSNKAIAGRCDLSIKAIERHISLIAKALGIEPHSNEKSLRMLVVLEYLRLSRNDRKEA
ncbi:MAG: LuxR C-terminal-related transcriptional regulator [Actinomycetes bacterium]